MNKILCFFGLHFWKLLSITFATKIEDQPNNNGEFHYYLCKKCDKYKVEFKPF